MIQLIEALGSAFLNYTTGMVVYMVHTWPSAAIPAGVFVSVTLIVIVLVFAMSTSSGSHINTIVTIYELFSGLCHPVRAAVYIFCQVLGGVLGGAFLTAGVGRERALTIHNGGCWLDPSGPTTISQAFSVEFMSSLCVLLVQLHPRRFMADRIEDSFSQELR
jgi:glycerol uptake facilitator-like aquaporin